MNDYERGNEQFRKMVDDDKIGPLIDRFKAVCPDFEKEVIGLVGGFGKNKRTQAQFPNGLEQRCQVEKILR